MRGFGAGVLLQEGMTTDPDEGLNPELIDFMVRLAEGRVTFPLEDLEFAHVTALMVLGYAARDPENEGLHILTNKGEERVFQERAWR